MMKLTVLTVFLIGAILLASVGLVTLAVETQRTVYFVAPDGDDANAGTLDRPWRTVAKANQELQAGDTVYIRAGTYDEIIRPSNSGSSGSKITYTNYMDEAVTIRGQLGQQEIVNLSSRSYIVIDGFNMTHIDDITGEKFGWVSISGSGSQYNEIRNCTIIREGDPLQMIQDDYRERGILINGAKYNIIENNYIAGHNIGIRLTGVPRYNQIRNNTVSNTSQSSIVIGSSLGKIQGNLIEGNVLERSAIEDGIQFHPNYDAPDVTTDTSNRGTIVRSNVIRYNAENAIDLKGAAYVVIEDNIIYGNIGSSNGPLHEEGWNRRAHSTITRGADRSTKNVIIRYNLIYDSSNGIKLYDGYKVYNNTIVANNRDYTGPDSDYDPSDTPAFWGVRQPEWRSGRIAIQNNIVASHNTVEVVLRKLDPDETTYIDNNLYYNTQGVYFAYFRTTGDWRKLTFEQWQNHLQDTDCVSGNDGASFIADPMFVNAPERPVGEPEQFDFHLQDISPAVDAGGPLTWAEGSGSGTQIRVRDAGYFFNGYGVTDGDLIQIGLNGPVKVISVDYDSNVITVDRSVSWEDGDGVSLPYAGAAPDIGAYEYQVYGFTLTAAPASRAINPGSVATYTVSIRPVGCFTATVALSAAVPSPSLTLTLTPTVATLPTQATLAVTDTHTGTTLLPGLWYSIPVTATGGGVTQTVRVGLLVGGPPRIHLPLLFLPVILRDYV